MVLHGDVLWGRSYPLRHAAYRYTSTQRTGHAACSQDNASTSKHAPLTRLTTSLLQEGQAEEPQQLKQINHDFVSHVPQSPSPHRWILLKYGRRFPHHTTTSYSGTDRQCRSYRFQLGREKLTQKSTVQEVSPQHLEMPWHNPVIL